MAPYSIQPAREGKGGRAIIEPQLDGSYDLIQLENKVKHHKMEGSEKRNLLSVVMAEMLSLFKAIAFAGRLFLWAAKRIRMPETRF